MVKRYFTGSLSAELYFWLGIMRDHAQFLLMNLAPTEKEKIREVLDFRRAYLELYGQAKSPAEGGAGMDQSELVRRALRFTNEFMQFKEGILRQQLRCSISINQPPTFTQQMINEAEEFVDVLSAHRCQQPQCWLEQHLLWLPDAWVHASFVAAALDATEFHLVLVAKEYQKLFEQFHLKAEELDSMVGEDPEVLRIFEGFNRDVAHQVQAFQEFLRYLRDEIQACRVLTFLTPLVPDHMAREEQYYLEKLAYGD